jgi:Flp pilus assembly protein CpaB
MLSDGMKAVTIRVNDVEGVAGFCCRAIASILC